MQRIFVAVILLLFLTRCDSPPPNTLVHEAIPYCKGDQHNLLLDIVEPNNADNNRPVVLMVHGGGWQAGSRKDYRPLMYVLAQKNIVTVSVDYRFVQEAKFPAQIQDVKCAARWLHAHAREYRINAQHIVAMGGSAGAHLVALLGTTPQVQAFEGTGGYANEPSQISAMILHGGALDLSAAFTDESLNKSSRNLVLTLLNAKGDENPELFSAANPITHISSATVPTLLIHGENDPIVPVSQSEKFYQALQKAGIESQLLIVKNGGHQDFGVEPETSRISTEFFNFLQRHLEK